MALQIHKDKYSIEVCGIRAKVTINEPAQPFSLFETRLLIKDLIDTQKAIETSVRQSQEINPPQGAA